MRTRVRRWLSAPIFPDAEQTRIAGLLNLLLIALSVLLLLDAALLLVFAPETIPTFWINGVGILVSCLLLWMMRRGRVRLAGIILCLTLWPLLVYYLAISGGLGSPTLGFLSLFIVIGVTLFGTRGAIGLGLLNLVCLILFYLAGSSSLLVSIEGSPSLARLFATNTVLFLLLSALVAISGRSVHEALERARTGELTLAERNRELNREIAERKQVEEALRASRETLQAIIDVSPLAIAVLDIHSLVQLWNPAAERIFGWTAQEVLDQPNPTIPTEYQDEYQSFVAQVFDGGHLTAQEAIRRRKDGSLVTVNLSSAALYDSQGALRARMAIIDDITERKRAEDALRESEERYRVISEMISDYAFSIRVEPDGTMVSEWITESFTRMTGYTLSEMLDRETQQQYALFHPEDRTRMNAEMASLLRGNSLDNEYRMITKAGEVRWMHFYRHPVWEETQQRVVRYYGIVQDITKRIRAEQELQRHDTILEALSAATNSLLKATDWQQEIVNVLGILGRAALVDRAALFKSHSDAQGKLLASLHYEWNASDILPMRDNPLAYNIDLFGIELGSVIDQVALRQPVYFHVRERPPSKRALGESTGTKTFSLHPILLHGALWGALVLAMTREERDWSKTELEAVQIAADMLGTMIERKQAEDALSQSAARLNILHRIDRAILAATSSETIAQAALQSIRQLTPWQSAAIEVVDFETAERVLLAAAVNGEHGQSLGSRRPLDPGWLATFREGQTSLVVDVHSSPYMLPVFPNLMDESVRSLAVMPLVAHNKVIGSLDLMANEPDAFTQESLEIGREVADQVAIAIEHAQLYELAQRHAAALEQRVKERTAQLEAANKELRLLSSLKDEFVSNVSHELRTPITSLKLRYYLLSKRADQLNVHLPVIQRETDRLARIIEDLLALSRMDQDRMPLNLTMIDLNSLIQAFVSDRLLLAKSRDLTLSTDFASGPLRVQADAGLLEQVLSILLTNALNYTPSGGKVILGTQMRRREKRLEAGFSVSDTGIGINHKDQDQLFSRFFRGQAGRESGVSGTGLGLALAKEIVERHNGRIEVDSEGSVGRGATFTVWLPGLDED